MLGSDTDARAARPADRRASGRWVGPTSRLLRHEHEQNLASVPSHSTCRAPPACEPPQTGCSESKAGCRRSIEGQRRRWGCQAHCRGAPWSMALASPIALRAPSMSLLEDARAEEDGRADEGSCASRRRSEWYGCDLQRRGSVGPGLWRAGHLGAAPRGWHSSHPPALRGPYRPARTALS